MRSTLLPALMGVLVATAGSAWAQNQDSSSGGGYVYVPSTGDAATIYNTGKDALTPQIAGRNAPSYVSPKAKSASEPYLFGDQPSSGYGVSPDEIRAAQAMREQQARQAQQQYLNDMQKNGGTRSGAEELQKRMSQYNPLMEEEQKPKKRRVVYNQRNNESAIGIPPRLFNPDQR